MYIYIYTHIFVCGSYCERRIGRKSSSRGGLIASPPVRLIFIYITLTKVLRKKN